MMKKLFISLCLAVLLTATIVLPSVHAEERNLENLPICTIDGFMTPGPETFKELEDGSSCIVKAVRSEDSENYLPTDDTTGFTLSTLTITVSFKGDLKAGDTVPFIETYYIDTPSSGERRLHCYFGHRPILPGHEYILFIGPSNVFYDENKPWSGTYSTSYFGLSQYAVPSGEAGSADASIPSRFVPNSELYREFYPAVLKKYNT